MGEQIKVLHQQLSHCSISHPQVWLVTFSFSPDRAEKVTLNEISNFKMHALVAAVHSQSKFGGQIWLEACEKTISDFGSDDGFSRLFGLPFCCRQASYNASLIS